MPQRSYHTTDLIQEIYWGWGQKATSERRQERDREKGATVVEALEGYATRDKSGNVSHLVASKDMAVGTELLKAGWGNTWLLPAWLLPSASTQMCNESRKM